MASSTRVVLLHGHEGTAAAGKVIEAFGHVAIGSLMHDLPFGESFRQYALLTIGDGLVAQIPAPLLSAAAIIVTRMSDAGDLSQQIGSQLRASPSVLYSAAAVMGVLAVIPDMPWLTFLCFTAVLAFAAWRMDRWHKARLAAGEAEALGAALLTSPTEPELNWSSLPVVEPISVALGYKLVGQIDQAQGAPPLLKRVKDVRQNLSEQLGVLLPPIGVRDDLALKPSQYSVLLAGCPLPRQRSSRIA
jgi:flagellar biosynthesis protein FlhA